MTDHGGAQAPEYHRGKMDIRDQERTFAGFMRFATGTTIAIVLFLVFLALVNG